MKRVVYLIEQPLDKRNYDRFGIQTWINRGWDVEVWDLTPLAHPVVWNTFIESGNKLHEFEGYFPVARKSQLGVRFSKVGRIGHFIDLTGDEYWPLRVKMSLVRRGAARVSCAIGLLPDENQNQRGLVSRFGRLLAKGPAGALGGLTMASVRRLARPFIQPGLVVLSGKKSIGPTGNDYEALRAHNLDYDIYLALKSVEVPTEQCAVFIDQDLCFHSDNIREGIESYVTPSTYFPALCKGLRRISALLKVSLRIAAHPRAYRYRGADCFEGIPAEYGKTAELIRSCRLVLCHYSTAAQFAVLFRKPIVFVTTDELVSSPGGKYVAEFASAFGKSAVNLDGDLDSVDWQKELRVDDQRYDAYRNEYIKVDGSPDRPYWDIVIDHIDESAQVR